MRHFKDLSIKKKLLLIITSINLFALALAFAGFIAYDVMMFREKAKEDLSIMADLIGYNCTASLVFNDPDDAREILSAFKVDNSIVKAWIFTEIGNPFAGYVRDGAQKPARSPQRRQDGFYFEDGGLSCFQPILLRGVPVGTIFIQSDLSGIYSILMRHLGIIAVVLLLSLLCAFLLSTRLQHLITRPLMNLGDLARSVSRNKDYSIRGTKEGTDETGELIDAFNEMLEQIGQKNESLLLARRETEISAGKAHRLADETKQANIKLENEIKVRQRVEEELKKHRAQLEKLVAQRTAELTKANEQLSCQISERKGAEEKIRVSLKEKDTLLGEIHHRVRNNLQVISSLLDLTKRRTLNDEARTILSEAKSRIHTMALIHSQLYESEDFNRIDMGKHLHRLIGNIQEVYGSWNKRGVIESSDVYLSVIQAIPCALVFHEAISNVFKHAYKKDESGTCYISMRRSDDNRVFARVRDEGVGIPESVDVDKTETLGLKLLRNLVLHQLHGKFRIEQNGGTDLFFEFDIMHDDELIHGKY